MSNDEPQADLALNTPTDEIKFEPIKGYPMLHWRGKRPFTSTQYYPAQHKETYGTDTNGWFNKIFWGDNLQVMSHLLREYRGKVDLIYIDPPFDSKADYKKKIQLRGKTANNDHSGFEEKQYTDIWSNDDYLQFMYERLILLRELLSERGSIFLHCDTHKNHLLRLCMDEIFGSENFVNEIIWKRSGVHASKKGFGPVHDHILFYSKKSAFFWNQQYAPYDQKYIDEWFSKEDSDDRKYGLVVMSAPGERLGTKAHYEWNGLYPPSGRHWGVTIEKMQELLDAGRLEHSKNGVPYQRKYLDESKGIPVNDIWTDTGHIKSKSLENVRYPTQKPEKLIKRIISAATNSDGLVFDPFMGSGTTQAVAMKMGRRFIGADINLGAIETTTKRLNKVASQLAEGTASLLDNEEATHYTGLEVYNVNHYDVFRNPLQAKELLIEALEIQPLASGSSVFDGEKDSYRVKVMPVNRVATRADLGDLIAGLDYKAYERHKEEKPAQPVDSIMLVCMGHEPSLAGHLQNEVPYKLDIQVVDVLRDKANLEFKRDAEADVSVQDGQLIIDTFYPMNLLQKLSLMKEEVADWRELVDSIKIDFYYDEAVLEPQIIDVPYKEQLVSGSYEIPVDASRICVKVTDLLSESLEVVLEV